MRKKYVLMLDSSFKSAFCYYTQKKPDVKNRFNKVLINIENKLPGFENDYEVIEMPFSFLEYIGYGQFLVEFSENEKIELENCFLSSESLSDAMKNAQNYGQRMSILDNHILQTHHRLVRFFMCNVDPFLLVSKANKKLSKFPVHENIIEIENCLHDWKNCLSNNGRNSPNFYLLCVHLAWDMTIRHKWCEDETRNHNFIHRLIAFYAAPGQFEHNLPGSALFGALKGQIPFRKYEELLDPNLIDLACRGYFNTHSNKWIPVIVLSCDKEQQKERLKSYITGAKYANTALGSNSITFVPGYFILTGQSGLEEDIEIIDIAQMIEDIQSNS